MNLPPIKQAFVTTLLCLWSLTCAALESDSKQKVYIESDSATLNRQQQTSVFIGNVKIDQGSTHIRADKLTLYFDDHEKIKRAVAEGNLAHYQTQPEAGKPVFHARAQSIEYNLASKVIELKGNATAEQGENRFKGPHILYNMQSQTILSAKKAGGRTTIVLDPQSDYWRRSTS